MSRLHVLSTLGLAVVLSASSANAELPNEEKYSFLKEITRTLNFAAPGVTPQISSGGTSVYGIYVVNGKPLGAVLPENSATKISGEIMTFNIARALGVDDLYSAAIYHRLQGSSLRAFRSVIPNTPYKNKWKEKNRQDIIARIAKSPNGIDTAYKQWGKKPSDYDAIVSVSSNSFNSSHVVKGSTVPFAEYLKCNGTRPSQNVTLTINGGTASAFELARELSTIFLIDALSQQWDRFSGGNLQTVTSNGSVKFVAFDNGGTWGGTSWTNKFLSIVTRFDRDAANEILAMDRFLTHGGTYSGLRSEAEFAAAMGVEKFPAAVAAFKKSLKLVAAHINKNAGCYF